MDIESVSRVIAVIIAPTVLITSCSLLINGLLQRLENRSTRLRGMNVGDNAALGASLRHPPRERPYARASTGDSSGRSRQRRAIAIAARI